MNSSPVQARTQDERVIFDLLEERGEATVQAELKGLRWKANEQTVHRWLFLKQEQRDMEAAALAKRNVEATESAAASAIRSADAAAESARHAMLAWIVALVGVIVAACIALYPILKPSDSAAPPTTQQAARSLAPAQNAQPTSTGKLDAGNSTANPTLAPSAKTPANISTKQASH